MVDTPTADTPREPDISHVNPAEANTWFGHPRQLARLFTTEMWERFGYYGMRALLTLYLTKHFLFDDRTTNGLYGGFTALVYLTPLIGGFLADRYLGSKRSVKFGAIIMALGYFILCFGGETARPHAIIDGQRYEVQVDNFVDRPTSTGNEQRFVIDNGQRLLVRGNEDGTVTLLRADGTTARQIAEGGFEANADRPMFFVLLMLVGLSMVTIGNGFFKPNISTIVGTLYDQGDRRRDAGFTIFYMGINLGSLFSQLLCPFLADAVGWWAGFGLAALGMLFSWSLIQFDGGRLDGYGERPADAPANRDIAIYIGALIAVPVVIFLFWNLMSAPRAAAGTGIVGYLLALPIMGKVLFGTFLIGIPAILIWSWRVGSKAELQMMLAAMVLIVFNVVFWTLFEQAGSSLTLFADRNTDLRVAGEWSISAGQTQFFNAFFIVVLAPVFSMIWTALSRRRVAPSGSVQVVGYLWTILLTLIGLYLAWNVYVMLPVRPVTALIVFLILAAITLVSAWSWFRQITGWEGETTMEPSIPVKFAIALMGVGAGFLFLVWGAAHAGADFRVALWWLAGLYLIHSLAELCISPVGLSMITKLSIARIVGLMMGVWFLSISCAQYVAGVVAQVASVETVGGQVTNLQVSLQTYVGVFWTIGLISAGIGVYLLLISPLIKRWMHGVQ